MSKLTTEQFYKAVGQPGAIRLSAHQLQVNGVLFTTDTAPEEDSEFMVKVASEFLYQINKQLQITSHNLMVNNLWYVAIGMLALTLLQGIVS